MRAPEELLERMKKLDERTSMVLREGYVAYEPNAGFAYYPSSVMCFRGTAAEVATLICRMEEK